MSSKEKVIEFLNEILEEKKARKNQFSGALTVRKGTVKRFWKLLALLKSFKAQLSRDGESTEAAVALHAEKLNTLKEHEEMAVNLKALYKNASDEVWEIEQMIKALEDI